MPHSTAKIRSVVFDMDDTLYPERLYVRSGYCAIAEHLRAKTGRDEPFEQWLWDRFLAGQFAGAFDALAKRFALDFGADDIPQLVKIYREHTPNIRPFGGMAELLGRLKPEFRLGLLSDGFMPAQRLKLQALKIERFFGEILFTEQISRDAWKPSPIGYNTIASSLKSPHAACAYIGDNPTKDFLAPNRLGWRTVQYLHPGQIHSARPAPDDGRPQFIVRSPGELLAALRSQPD